MNACVVHAYAGGHDRAAQRPRVHGQAAWDPQGLDHRWEVWPQVRGVTTGERCDHRDLTTGERCEVRAPGTYVWWALVWWTLVWWALVWWARLPTVGKWVGVGLCTAGAGLLQGRCARGLWSQPALTVWWAGGSNALMCPCICAGAGAPSPRPSAPQAALGCMLLLYGHRDICNHTVFVPSCGWSRQWQLSVWCTEGRGKSCSTAAACREQQRRGCLQVVVWPHMFPRPRCEEILGKAATTPALQHGPQVGGALLLKGAWAWDMWCGMLGPPTMGPCTHNCLPHRPCPACACRRVHALREAARGRRPDVGGGQGAAWRCTGGFDLTACAPSPPEKGAHVCAGVQVRVYGAPVMRLCAYMCVPAQSWLRGLRPGHEEPMSGALTPSKAYTASWKAASCTDLMFKGRGCAWSAAQVRESEGP